MRVMLDTNILISCAYFHGENLKRVTDILTKQHRILLCSYSLEELTSVTLRKFPRKIRDMEDFLLKLPFELIHTPSARLADLNIRDEKDYPILLSALSGGADILLTGDKDFEGTIAESLEIMTPRRFADKYGGSAQTIRRKTP